MAEEEIAEAFSEDEVDQDKHNKLLSAVSRIYKKQRVDKPKRSEPFVNVSEYHLSSYDKDEGHKEEININDLVTALGQKNIHQKIKSKFNLTKTAATKLPKPLEKIYADKIKRSVGYEHLKQHVSRWNEIIENNRTAPQLSFPLKDEQEIKVYKPFQFLDTFKEPTELEKNLAEALQKSEVAQVEAEIDDALFNLSLPEMIEKRKLLAKLKAKESFKIVKAMKQNKIKSKKFRRVMRKEKLKQELKDFETLQKTDPEAALEKLDKLEKERVEERASLRHRNTGKWARGQAIRARYDKEARIQLAEQIAKSRQLTQKRKLGDESSSEEELDDDEEDNDEYDDKMLPNLNKQPDDNPWTTEDNGEKEETVEEFIAGYQNYWKNRKDDQPGPKPKINSAAMARLIGKNPLKEVEEDKNGGGYIVESPSVGGDKEDNIVSDKVDKILNDKEDKIVNDKEDKIVNDKEDKILHIIEDVAKDGLNSINVNKFSVTKDESQPKKVNINSKEGVKSKKKTKLPRTKVELNGKIEKSVANNDIIINKLVKSKTKKRSKDNFKNVSGSWEVSSELLSNTNSKKQKANNLDDLFNRMDDDLQEKFMERLKKFDNNFSDSEDEVVEKKKQKETKEETQEPKDCLTDETTRNTNDGGDNEIDKLLKTLDRTEKSSLENRQRAKDKTTDKEPAIDPNKFLNIKPRILNTQLPDVITEGDEQLDDPEDGDRRAHITEAFAEDDVVQEFTKEKEKERKESEAQDINLFMPGWGSWGGPDVDPKMIRKKKRRFFVKAPKFERKDVSKPNVIINNDISQNYKDHFVNEIPFPFTSVRNYEASIRAPIGSTWVPESAVNKLIRPPIVKKLGTVIEPMTENYLMKNSKKRAKLNIHNLKRSDNKKIK